VQETRDAARALSASPVPSPGPAGDLGQLLAHWPGVLFRQQTDFSFSLVTPRVEELTGVSVAEWQRRARDFWTIIHEADAAGLRARLSGQVPVPAEVVSTFRVRHIRTGRVSYIWEHRRCVRGPNGALLGFEGVWMDITRQTIAERRLLSLSWRENLGTLTMGLAHDFCNLMAGIVGLSETFEASVPGESPLKNGLSLIRKTALQASQLAQRMRQLHQGLPGERSYQDLNEAVASIVEVLRKVLPRNVRVQTQFEPGQQPLYIDPVELQQVVVNLALNAADAMPEGGELTFHTARHAQSPALPHSCGTPPRPPLLRFSVQDTGTGIPERLLASIFDPFFTTKPLGKGSGLGLYNARLFAEKHGAAISVETKEGAGTTFHFWFGQADFTEAEESNRPQQPARHTLLVVGAAGEPREHLVETLRQNGYYVVPAASEAEVDEALRAPHFQFTSLLLLCAGNRPEDAALYQRIRAQHLPLKTIITAFGCNQDELDTQFIRAADALVPFDLPAQEFLARIKGVLDGA